MKVYSSISHIPAFEKAVLTIGTFDGVHLGHRQILQQLREEALRIGGETVILTFHPHPRKVVHQDKAPVRLINSIEEKIELLRANGIDHLVIIPFTPDFASMSAASYIEDFLLKNFRPHTIIIGYDHRFGRNREGDYHLLERYSRQGAFQLKEIPEKLVSDNIVSSTRIRSAVAEGKMEEAAQLLGYPFFFSGKVMHGRRLGHSLGFPTANLDPGNPEKLLPGDGVYAVRAGIFPDPEPEKAEAPHLALEGMMNIGYRPTVDGRQHLIEVHLFHFSGDLYDRHIRVLVPHRIRSEQKFESLDALRKQLEEDRILAGRLLSGGE